VKTLWSVGFRLGRRMKRASRLRSVSTGASFDALRSARITIGLDERDTGAGTHDARDAIGSRAPAVSDEILRNPSGKTEAVETVTAVTI
jgi:hypothetical protein